MSSAVYVCMEQRFRFSEIATFQHFEDEKEAKIDLSSNKKHTCVKCGNPNETVNSRMRSILQLQGPFLLTWVVS